MKRSVKSCIAYVAACAITGKQSLRLHDCSRDEPALVSGKLKNGEVDVRHTKKGYHLTGHLPSISDKKHNLKIELEIDGSRFSGKEKRSGVKFKGKVSDKHVSLVADGYISYLLEY